MRSIALSILLCLCGPFVAAAEPTWMICFEGKSSFISYDGGVIQEAYERWPVLREGKVILAGNSSGALLAAYFACHGFNEKSLANCRQHLLESDSSVLRNVEAPGAKALKLMRHEQHPLTPDALREHIAFTLGVPQSNAPQTLDELISQSQVKIQHPLLIVAANREVLMNCPADDLLRGLYHKQFDPLTFSVSWQQQKFDFYRQHPDRFARDCPDLRLGKTPYIGKALTFFVDRSLYENLSQIAPDQRMADLRLMETPADIAEALMASLAVPTYFQPHVERSPEKLLCGHTLGDLGTSSRRSYCGGYLLLIPARDLRRTIRDLRVFATGTTYVPSTARRYLQAMYLIDVEAITQLEDAQADINADPPTEVQQAIWNKRLSASDEYAAGQLSAKQAFARHPDLLKTGP